MWIIISPHTYSSMKKEEVPGQLNEIELNGSILEDWSVLQSNPTECVSNLTKFNSTG